MAALHYLLPLCVSALLLHWAAHLETRDPGPLSCEAETARPRLEERLVVVTGATTHTGYQVALELARAGARLVLGCRDAGRGRAVRDRLVAASNNSRVSVLGLDLASLRHVATFAWNLRDKLGVSRVDAVVHMAGAGPGRAGQLTREGLDTVVATNLLGPLHLATRLLDILGSEAVIVNMVDTVLDPELAGEASPRHSAGQDSEALYQLSQHWLRLATTEMAARFAAVKPGVSVYTSVAQRWVWPSWPWLHSLPRPLVALLEPLLGPAPLAREAGRATAWLAGGGARGRGSGDTWRGCGVSLGAGAGDSGRVWRETEEMIQMALQS